VLVRKGQTLAATFHPELSDDRRIHQYFLNLVAELFTTKNTKEHEGEP
jgi:pyridoxal 5'-phosphate synthase pdxT subunit